MRLALFICLFFCSAFEALAQDLGTVTQRGRGISEVPLVQEGLQVSRFANGLGDITAITGHTDGTLYVSDTTRGRVYQLVDRNKDGIPDLSRVIADGFNSPSGVAILGADLYVSDEQAIWKLPLLGGPKRMFVNLSNSQSRSFPRPLLIAPAPNPREIGRLLLGVTKLDGEGQVISIDPATKKATRIAQGPHTITALARSGRSLWVGTKAGIVPVKGETIAAADFFKLSAPVTGLLLPGQYPSISESFAPWSSHMLVALGHEERKGTLIQGSQVKSIATKFGNTSGRPKSFISGFVSRGGRTGWGKPGPMWMDERGLFLSDSWSGTVWRVSGSEVEFSAPEPVAVADIEIDVPEASKSTALPLIDGIEQTPAATLKTGSQIESASSLEYGSSITQKWEAAKKAKEDAKREARQQKSKEKDVREKE